MRRMVTDAELVTDQVRNAAAGPDRATKAAGFGTPGQQRDELRTLVCRQQRRWAGRRVVAQGGDAMRSGPFEPLADGALRDAQRRSNVLRRPSVLMQRPGTVAAAFVPAHWLVMLACAHGLNMQHIPAHDY
jgi:hypothetical protein